MQNYSSYFPGIQFAPILSLQNTNTFTGPVIVRPFIGGAGTGLLTISASQTVGLLTATGTSINLGAAIVSTGTSGTLTFEANQTNALIVIPIVNDSLAEVNETFSITLSEVTGGATLAA
jgi:hypothetical protein